MTAPPQPTGHRLRDAIALVALTALAAVGLAAPAHAATTAPPVHPDQPSSAASPNSHPAARTSGTSSTSSTITAERRAKATGKPVVITALTTATQQIAANPKGGLILTESAAPVRVYRQGRWIPIDTTLHANANGTYSPAAVATDLYLSGGGHTPLATIVSDGHTFSVSWPTALPKPSPSGDTLTYANVMAGVDLKVTADQQGGFREVLVVKTAQAAANPSLSKLNLATSAPGLSLSADKAGNLTARDNHGQPVFFAPTPIMWDSSTTQGTPAPAEPRTKSLAGSSPVAVGAGAHRARIAARVVGRHSIALTPDRAMLTSKSTHYPLYIDPNWDTWTGTKPGYFEAQQGCPSSANSYNNTTYEPTGDGVGYNGWSGCIGIEETYLQFTLSSTIYNTDISSATLKATESATSSSSLSANVSAHLASSTIGSGSDWNNKPSFGSALDTHSVGPVTSSSNPSVGFNVKSAVTGAKRGGTLTFALTGDESTSGSNYFKRFFVSGTYAPTLVVLFNAAPQVASAYTDPGTTCSAAAPFSTIGHTAITLKAKLTDSDPGQTLTAHFTYSHYNGSQIAAATPTQTTTSGGVLSWNIGSQLTSGQYTWSVYANDGIDNSATTTCHFTVDVTAPNQPVLSSSVFPTTDRQPTTNNPARTAGGTGDFTFDPNGSTDVAKYAYSWGFEPPTVNPPLTVPAAGGSTPTQVTLTPPSTGLNVLYVRSIDSAGNISGTAAELDVWTQYGTPTVSVDGDFNGDGVPDIVSVGTSSNPGLWLYEGNADSNNNPNGTLAAPMQIGEKGTVNGSGQPSDWNGVLITHGVFNTKDGTQDLLVRTSNGAVTVYPGTGDSGDNSTLPPANQDLPPLNVNIVSSDGTSTPQQDWFQDQQLVAAGALSLDSNGNYLGALLNPNSYGISPDLWAIQGDALGYYPSTTAEATYNPFTVISPSGWENKTIIDAGVVNGLPALWSRDNSTGELDLWTTNDPNIPAGSPQSSKATFSTSGFSTSDYSMLASAGDNGPGGCPELWGVAASTGEMTFIPCSSMTALAATSDAKAKASGIQALDATTTTAFNHGNVIAQLAGDFHQHGRSDVAHLYDYGSGHLALEVEPSDANGDGGFGQSYLAWDGPSAGANTSHIYAATGDFNGDKKTDIALFYNYTDNNGGHVKIQTLTADASGDGRFAPPATVWDSTNFGPGTQMMTAGDFNGDGKTDIALFYHYSDYSGHVAVLTLKADSNGDGGFAPSPTTVWDNTNFGPGTQMMTAGDFNGDGKTDIALFYEYADINGHVALFTMTADSNGDGGLGSPTSIWSSTNWGPNTKWMTAGDFNGDGKTDIALFYNYTANNSYDVAIFTLNGQAGAAPSNVWSNTDWGPNSQYLVAGDFNADGKADLGFYYDYAAQAPALFTLTADASGDGGFASPVLRSTGL
ncbi:FG-GAP-like repeat-containing protein [Streptomyces sp. NPDC093984]|uniref:FG-GAP-like repeat-containing protein n=1 Tax=Streptomyces sp. NPDC093984 TaxID=3366052 RepID=UPI003803244C